MMTEIVLVQKAVSKVFGDFVSKVVSDGVDVLKSAIKDADLDRKSYNQNLQTRLYQLMIDALNRFTHNNYRNQDKLYDAAESIIKGYISTQDDIDAVKLGLKMLVSDVNSDTCQDFLEILCGEICRDDNSDLYKEIDMLWKRQESEHFRGEFAKVDQNDREILEQLNDLREVLDFIKRNMNRKEGDKLKNNGIPIVNRANEYAQRWNENVFLNDFNEEDENAGINIKLREIYVEECLPHYIWESNSKPSKKKLRVFLNDYIFNNQNKKMLLILGQPGIGKSTLITWIMANLVEKKDDILVYQFASDLGNINWLTNNILEEIFTIIDLEYNELEGKALILDGFDEIYIKEDRERILHKLNQELEKKNFLKTFSLIITCRENYVDRLKLKKIEYITLQAWDEGQIRNFCKTYEKVIIRRNSELRVNKNMELRVNKIIEKKDIMGVPLILYMVLALDIDIERSSSIVDIYDQIFSLEVGGIYDRSYDAEHRINAPEIKKHIHHISQRIAFWMFENNADEAIISREKFEEICENEMKESTSKNEGIKSDTLIGNFFQIKHCEGKGTSEIQFVHRSIYEYFATVYFFESVCKLQSKEELAGKLGELLKDGDLSKQILEFLKYKFDKMKKYNLGDITKEVFNVMLRDGMTYYFIKEQKEPLLNIIDREMNIFSNMLKIVGLWNSFLEKLDKKIIIYLQCNRENSLSLSGANLSGENLRGANFMGSNLSEANLCGANLGGAILSGVDLRGANLSEAYLIGADLRGADLKGADINGANLREAYLNVVDLNVVDLRRADLSRTDLSGTNLSGVNLSGAYFRDANFRGANLSEANLSKAVLSGADLSGANLSSADLSRVELVGSDLGRADLSGANLSEVYLDRTNLCKAVLSGADLSEASLYGTIFDEEQVHLLHGKYDLSKSHVLLSSTGEIITCQDYCIRKQIKFKRG